MTPTAAEVLAPVLRHFVGDSRVAAFGFWDGSRLGPEDAPATLHLRSADALRRLLWAPNELGLARAYVSGDLDIEGDIFGALELRNGKTAPENGLDLTLGRQAWLALFRAARKVHAVRLPPPPPPEEARLGGRRHSRRRDAGAISHHYDVSNDFYRLLLGDSMTYSCAYFSRAGMTLDEAQDAKHELICRKLGLHPGSRLLDVGCGWGSMVIHAALHHGVSAVGITISENQAELAAKRVAEAGVGNLVEIRLQDYRDVPDGPFDAISSIGMFEHVGLAQLGRYFDTLRRLLKPKGRLLNHAISRPDPSDGTFDRGSFVSRYVFPDGELHEVGHVVSAMQRQGLEVRDVESLREHYALTLRRWVGNLNGDWERAMQLAGAPRARIWRLYMAGAALGFEAGRISVHQVLAVKSQAGDSGMPRSRKEISWF
ncbi:MAG: class I SAM-dependent methyltransferase [Actinobacteria bacterium]|nr:class I SAM-dependent methyltransferase [Actinomycetota bacterium]